MIPVIDSGLWFRSMAPVICSGYWLRFMAPVLVPVVGSAPCFRYGPLPVISNGGFDANRGSCL